LQPLSHSGFLLALHLLQQARLIVIDSLYLPVVSQSARASPDDPGVATFAGASFIPGRAWLPGGMLGVALTLMIATLSWKYFEKPLLRRGHRHAY
jgi:hypothetical protein